LRTSFSSCLPAVIVLLTSSCTASFAQGYGITVESQIQSALEPYTLNGALYDPSCTVNGPNIAQIPETSYSLTPLSCGGPYEAADPQTGALYSESAVATINSALVNKGNSYISLSSIGGTADPNIGVGGFSYVYLLWQDTLTVTGPPLGTPVQLQVTDYRFTENVTPHTADVGFSHIGPRDTGSQRVVNRSGKITSALFLAGEPEPRHH
jgi:hypothetical protein